jgi:anthranilate/para-aminobenzoate synthase component II
MFKIVATDTWNGIEFIDAFEAYNYPIYGIMFHPEY